MHKIETHLHTSDISKCGRLGAAELAKGYHEAGYHAIAVTDHYNRTTFDRLGVDLQSGGDIAERFLEGYRKVAAECRKYGIIVYQGAEVRFDECENDYLIYGFRKEFLNDPEKIFRMGISNFASFARKEGVLVIQAHPYRRKCTPAIACYLDGMEVCNGTPRYENYNERAEEYARTYGLIRTAGSDCHQTVDIGASGLLSEELPGDPFSFANLLRSRRYQLMCDVENEENEKHKEQ